VAAAVILPVTDTDLERRLCGVRDSKALSVGERVRLADVVRTVAVAWAVGRVDAVGVDALGIGRATALAMRCALAGLSPRPDRVLVDGYAVRLGAWPVRGIVRGDQSVLSIAAASIVAKVARDAELVAAAPRWPDYGFDAHKGYGAATHLLAIRVHGPCPYHRLTWAPCGAGRAEARGAGRRVGSIRRGGDRAARQ
jgi:ribonuclease HII